MSFKDELNQVVDQGRREGLRKAFASEHVDERVANASKILAGIAHLKDKVSPETWANVEAQVDMASATGDTDDLEAALDAAEAELKAKR